MRFNSINSTIKDDTVEGRPRNGHFWRCFRPLARCRRSCPSRHVYQRPRPARSTGTRTSRWPCLVPVPIDWWMSNLYCSRCRAPSLLTFHHPSWREGAIFSSSVNCSASLSFHKYRPPWPLTDHPPSLSSNSSWLFQRVRLSKWSSIGLDHSPESSPLLPLRWSHMVFQHHDFSVCPVRRWEQR
jgi:hypothetical protein